ncbi:MAG: hypothetical protein Q9227_008211 [Pyrenula ochraceoflavens]
MASILGSLMPKLGVSYKALLLGAGFVTKPTVQILSDSGVEVIVACRTLESAKKLCSDIRNTKAISLDVDDTGALEAELAKVDVVISLIPYTYHAAVIKSAIKTKTNVVTTSYVSPAMMELDAAAKEAGITVMNEIGLDPGIDHLYAVKTIEEVHRKGGKITSFLSYCGGLPAPEASDNPLGYKFSWSSRGVLLALRNNARYYHNGAPVEVPGEDLMGTAKPYFIYPAFAFVAYPNRDSTPFRARYSIPEAQNLLRGTLRYQGFPEFVRVLVDIGFLSEEPLDFLKPSSSPISWAECTHRVLQSSSSSSSEPDLHSAIAAKTSFSTPEDRHRILAGMKWLDMFSPTVPITPRSTPLDTLCATLERKMAYEEGERDMVMLQHKFEIEWANGGKETRTSTLCEYGDPEGYSAMARLVGVPCGVATLMVLKGEIARKGVLAPVDWELAEPLLKEVNRLGIRMVEKTLP